MLIDILKVIQDSIKATKKTRRGELDNKCTLKNDKVQILNFKLFQMPSKAALTLGFSLKGSFCELCSINIYCLII